VLVVMRAYLVERVLRRAWAELDMTVPEGPQPLKTICSLGLRTKVGGLAPRIQPRGTSRVLLAALEPPLPEALPHTDVRVVTRCKLPGRRKER